MSKLLFVRSGALAALGLLVAAQGGCGGDGPVLEPIGAEAIEAGAPGNAAPSAPVAPRPEAPPVDAGPAGPAPIPPKPPMAVADAGPAAQGTDARPVAPGTDARPSTDAARPRPQRLVVFYTPFGAVHEAWRPTGGGGALELRGTGLQALEPHKSKIVVIEGLDAELPGGASSLEAGPSSLLTGLAQREAGRAGWTGGKTSFDVEIGRTWGLATRLQSLELGVQAGSEAPYAISFRGPAAPLPRENDPRRAATRAGLPALMLPVADVAANESFPQVARAQLDLVVAALTTDSARVVSVALGDTRGLTRFDWLGAQAGTLRELAAGAGAPGPARDGFVRAHGWFAEQFAYLVGKLNAVQEAQGTLLDHTTVVWVSETGEAGSGSAKDLPIVVAGNTQRFRTGAHLRLGGRPLSDLFATIPEGAPCRIAELCLPPKAPPAP